MMPDADFFAWVEFHVLATGADDRVAETLAVNKPIVTGESWNTSLAELKLATQRLVLHHRTPKFTNEHLDAVGLELVAMRREAAADSRAARPQSGADCPECGGAGHAVVLHPYCVFDGHAANYRDPRTGESRPQVLTVAVLCDAAGCGAGHHARNAEDRRVEGATEGQLRQRPRLMTLSRYSALIGGHDGVRLLREYERVLAERGRQVAGPGEGLAALSPRLAAMARRAA